MIKCLFLVSTLSRTGPTSQLYGLIKYLDKEKFEPYVITLSPELADSRWPDYESLGVNLYSLNLSRVQGIFGAKKRVEAFIDEIKPNLIHTQGIRADSIISEINPRAPWFMTSRNYPWHDYVMEYGKVKGAILASLHLSVMRKCTHVIACSKTISNLLCRHGVNSLPIQNGVEFPLEKVEIPKLMVNLLKPIFISVGVLISRKNMRLIIEAFNSYSKKKKGSLVVLGDGSEMSELRSLSKENDNIHLLGNVTNVLDYLLASDYFISSSFSEGLPNTVLEALSTGLATILSDIPSHLEIAEVCSSSCEIFSLKDGLTGLEQKMLNADKIFSLKSKAEAKEKANKFFSAKSMSLNYQNEYIRAVSIV